MAANCIAEVVQNSFGNGQTVPKTCHNQSNLRHSCPLVASRELLTRLINDGRFSTPARLSIRINPDFLTKIKAQIPHL
ncbi:hypothetical protein Y032_0036g3258 [Ancylostoma ceylanicum]|uniref:Uncharacterized protein n=1 Tax=Ancylostoma ceylanicum TaxID=53326 RepID=A0A016ULB8_9BILA|nr:hypothetical protein Y032_0036g3258 [Ancylostoma ceylanicum]